MTWHQWHQTALIASSTGLSVTCASWNARSPHGRHAISAARFGRGEKWNSPSAVARSACSVTDLIQFDLVAERVEDVGAPPARDRVRLLEARTRLLQRADCSVQVAHAKREMPPRMEPEVAVGGQVDVARRRREPEAGGAPRRARPPDPSDPGPPRVEPPAPPFPPGRVKPFGVVRREANPGGSKGA